MNWTLLGEVYSFFVLFLLLMRYYWNGRTAAPNHRSRMFVRCLMVGMGSIAVNVICASALTYADLIPRWVNMGLNTLYFLFSIAMCTSVVYLVFDAILEHVYDKHCLRRATVMLSIVTVVSVLLVVANLFTGILFYFDEAGLYQRGPLNRVYYVLLLMEVIFVGVCYARNRASVGERMIYVMRSLPPVVVLLCVLQVLYPDVLLNGTICAVACLVIFMAFRSHTEDRDSQTGAGSRKGFMDELSLRTDSGQSLQMVQVAVLNVADTNLRYGYAVGDALLYEVSRYLRHALPHGRVFRTGSTTFTLMLPLESEEKAEANLRTLDERLRRGWDLGEIHCEVTFAMADLCCRDLTGRPCEAVDRLEYAMTLAKEKHMLVRFDEGVSAAFTRRSQLIALMRRALDERRFQVWYQPLYCCHHDIFCSAEALLRLNDEDETPVRPDVFIPLAEETGMIGELTWIVLEDACSLLSSDQLPGLESVSINLSMQQLLDPHLPEQIAAALARHGLEPKRLKVEITERFVLHDAQYAKAQLSALENLGVQVFMDDFGTGYSNLSSVLHFPFSFVKLDRSLIADLAEDRKADIMVSNLMRLFRDLGKRVVAEGVEEEAQVAYLKGIGVDMIQGFYYAKPMPADQLAPYFKR